MSKKFLENFQDSEPDDEDDPNMYSPEPLQPYDSRESRKELTQVSGSSQLKMSKKGHHSKKASKKASNHMKNMSQDQYKTRLMVDFIDQFSKAKALENNSSLHSQLNAIVRDAGKSTIAKPSAKLHGFEKSRHTIQGFKSSERIADLSMSAKVRSGKDVSMLKSEKQRIIDSYTRTQDPASLTSGFTTNSHQGSFQKKPKRNKRLAAIRTHANGSERR